MSYVPTMISGAVGEKAMGKPAANKPEDVKKVQSLLKKVFGASAPVFTEGLCDGKMKSAIADFQKAWGGVADATVDPAGQTLKRLDRLAQPLTLKPITMGLVSNGGYVIGVTACDGGPMPPAGSGYTLHLSFNEHGTTVDVTGQPAHDLLDKDNLGEVLTLFDKLGCWATPVQCRVLVRYKGVLVSTSDKQVLTAPVQPHNGRLLPLDETNNGSRLTYQGDPDARTFYGRMFATVPGFEKNVFVWAGKFETDNSKRGFDCITYAGTACGAANTHMAESADLANSLDAAKVDFTRKIVDTKTGKEGAAKVILDAADPAVVKDFFATSPPGHYLMWSGGHIVIVSGGNVHEFKASAPAGYCCTPVATWLEPYKSMKLTVRKLPKAPARAV